MRSTHALVLVSAALTLLAVMSMTAGCQWKTKVDTDGDGVPDREMTSEQLDRWLERSQAAAKAREDAEVERAKAEAAEIEAKRAAEQQRIEAAAKTRTAAILRDAKRRIAQADSSHTQLVAELQAESEEQIEALGLAASVDLTSANASASEAISSLEAATTAALAGLAAERERISDEVLSAKEAIEAQRGAVGALLDAVPQVAAVAGTGGTGTAALLGTGLVTSIATWLFGRKQGASQAEAAAQATIKRLDDQWEEQERNARIRQAELEQRRYVAQLEAAVRAAGGLTLTPLQTQPAPAQTTAA